MLYALSLCDGGHERAAVTFAPEGELQAVFEHHYVRGTDLMGDGPARPVVLVPERHCLVEFFGWDYGLPALRLAAEPKRVAETLAKLGLGECATIEVLRYRPHHRCVLRYPCATGAGERRAVIGKVYDDAQRAQRVWEQMPALRAEGRQHGIVIPARLALVEEGLLLMEQIEGRSLKQALADAATTGGVESLLTTAAATLASFHRLGVAGGEPFTLARRLATLQARLAAIAPVAPLFARQADEVLARLAEQAAAAGHAQATLIHGDFKPSQLLLTRDGVAVVDLDRTAPGDPVLDVGNFMAQFHKDALRPGQEGLRRLAEWFLSEYLRLGGSSTVADCAHLGRSLALVRMALRRFERNPYAFAREGPGSRAAGLLEEAAA